MGQLIIKVPQNINLKISVKSVEIVDQILRLVKSPNKKLETITLDLPYDLEDIDEDTIRGILTPATYLSRSDVTRVNIVKYMRDCIDIEMNLALTSLRTIPGFDSEAFKKVYVKDC